MDMNGWITLIVAIIFEVVGTLNLKLSNGLTELLPSVLVFLFYLTSVYLFSLALREIDVGVAYAVWAGLGTALVAVFGAIVFKDPVTLERIAWLACIIVGVTGLNLSGGGH